MDAKTIAIVVGLLGVGPLVAADPPMAASNEEAARLVEQLGSPSYARREAATRKLVELGESVRAEVTVASKSPDIEVRLRAAMVLEVIEVARREALRKKLEAQLDAFVTDAGNDKPYDLPGWDRYRRIVGNDKPARELFAELVRREGDSMLAMTGPAGSAREALAVRVDEWHTRLSSRLGGVAMDRSAWPTPTALAWLAGREDIELPANTDMVIYRLMAMTHSRTQVARGETALTLPGGRQEPLKKLVVPWIPCPDKLSTETITARLYSANQLDSSAGAAFAQRVLKEESKTATPYVLQMCIQMMARLGGTENIAVLESQLDNATLCRTTVVNGQRMEMQVRDFALSALLSLTKQDASKYGVRPTLETVGSIRPFYDDPASYNKTRDEAIKKYRAWREAQKQEPEKKGSGAKP